MMVLENVLILVGTITVIVAIIYEIYRNKK